jgi:hypothetical protein
MNQHTVNIKGSEHEVADTIEKYERSNHVTVLSSVLSDNDHKIVTVALKKKYK